MYTELDDEHKNCVHTLLAKDDWSREYFINQVSFAQQQLTPFMSSIKQDWDTKEPPITKAITVAKYYSDKPKDDWPEEIIKGVILTKMDI